MKKIITYEDCLNTDYSVYKKIVLIGGCFDILHYGHFSFLKEARAKGERLIILLESDQFIVDMKKREPVHLEKERAFMLSSLKYVDQVIILPKLNTYEDYKKIVHHIKPSIIAITKGDPQVDNKKKMINEIKGRVVEVADYIPNKSTSDIRKKLENMN